MTEHRIRWFARIPVGSVEAPDGWLPRTTSMRGSWGWDVRCSCGQETRTGGGTERYIRELIWLHKHGILNLGSWNPRTDVQATSTPDLHTTNEPG